MVRRRCLAGIFSICAVLSVTQVATPAQELPMVKSGEMPFYPPRLRLGQIEGDVRLRVTTDGSGVSSVAVESGHVLLAKAALENVKTWKFDQHTPTVFSTLFSYHLIKELVTYSCDPDIPDNGTVVLKLPAQVEITSHLRIRDCHDPNERLDLSEPLRVFLTGCEVGGSPIPCEKMTIHLRSGASTVTPKRFSDPGQKAGFVVPKELRSGTNFDLLIDAGTERSAIMGIHPNYLKGDWRIGIDHAPFKENTPVYGLPESVHCVAFVVIQWTEPGAVYWGACK
jgi:TonB family protein